jgi:hypothetical protein
MMISFLQISNLLYVHEQRLHEILVTIKYKYVHEQHSNGRVIAQTIQQMLGDKAHNKVLKINFYVAR